MLENLVFKFAELVGLSGYVVADALIGALGALNMLLFLVAAALFAARRVNRTFFKNQQPTLKKLLKPLAKIHPYLGITLFITAFAHGDLAMGTMFKIHTGPLTWWLLLVLLLLGTLGKKYKFPNWLPLHRIAAALLLVAIGLHLVARNIL